jgi:hypothetical protein
MKKPYFIFCILLGLFAFAAGSGFADFAFAQQEDLLANINFPISELGNCNSKSECKAHCDLEENIDACIAFAKAHNFLPQEQIEKNKKISEIMKTMAGPGNCQGKEECDIYCHNPEHMEECIIFGKEHGLIPLEELEEVEQVLQAIRSGVKPPPCQGKTECDIYCSQPEHLEECISFGEAAGFIDPEEAEMIRKTNGMGPGECRGKQECDAYCQDPEHMKECIEFGIKHNLMPPEEIKEAEMMLQALNKGIKPPPCQGKEECDIYCSQPEHMEECVNFGEAAGFIDPEEAEQMRNMSKAGIFGGPGNCQGKEECEAYCNDPEHMEECVDFSVKAGFMDLEESERIKKIGNLEMRGEFRGPGGCQSPEECDIYCQSPEHMEECMRFGQEKGLMTPEENKKIEIMFQLDAENSPGGCRTPQECKLYCDNPEHMEECLEFGKSTGLMKPEEIETVKKIEMQDGPGGPGGCHSKEECDIYCSQPEHIEECANFFLKQGLIDTQEAERIIERMEHPSLDMMKPEGMMMPPPEGEMMGPMEPGMMPDGTMPPKIEGMMMPPPPDGMMKPEGIMPPPDGMMPDGTMPPKPEGIMPPPPDGMMKPEGIMPPPDGMMPDGTMPPKIEGIMPPPPDGMMIPDGTMPPKIEGIMPPPPDGEMMPPKEAPQSLFDSVKQFLAGIIFGF